MGTGGPSGQGTWGDQGSGSVGIQCQRPGHAHVRPSSACGPGLANFLHPCGHPPGTRTSTRRPQTSSMTPYRSGSRRWAQSTLQ
jgi:hypothetical protein